MTNRTKTGSRMGRPAKPASEKRVGTNFTITPAEIEALDRLVDRLTTYCGKKGIDLAATRSKVIGHLVSTCELTDTDCAAIAVAHLPRITYENVVGMDQRILDLITPVAIKKNKTRQERAALLAYNDIPTPKPQRDGTEWRKPRADGLQKWVDQYLANLIA